MKATTEEYMAGLRRMVRAAGRRVGREDPEQLAELVALQKTLEEAIRDAVAGQRSTGITWQSIGEATGTTRQAAIQKWGHRRARSVA